MGDTVFTTKEAAAAERKWWLIDATGMPLGRLASEAARRVSGKHKPTWGPHVDCGDFVVVTNAEKIVLTGRKSANKVYRRHTQYPGGLKEMRAAEMLERKPTRMVELAVRGMLPKNRLGRAMAKKLKVVAGAEHPHAAQQPETLDVGVERRLDRR